MYVIDWMGLATVLTGLLSPIIAVLAVYIAWQQWKTNRSRELRESRQSKLSVYRRVERLLRHVLYEPILDPELYTDFSDACAEADFLFKDGLRKWLSELQDIADHCMALQKPLEDLAPDADLNSINEMQNVRDELIEKLRSAGPLLRDKFADHLV